jgi:hypothetical protein
MNKYNKLVASSVDPYKFSMTARGVLRLLIPVAMALAPFLSVSPDDLTAVFESFEGLLNSLDTLVAAGIGVYAAYEVVWGAFRKIMVKRGLIKVN